jgi:tRNA threonylcarbamoyladenosine biosynthesis protein TsaE
LPTQSPGSTEAAAQATVTAHLAPTVDATTHRTLVWTSEDDCARCAAQLADVPALRLAHIALHGNLGAGKTTWVRHLLRALGVTGRIKSPSYTIVEPYELPAPADTGSMPATSATPAWHFDFYRFADPQEWEDAGLRDLFASPGLKLVEWPERAADLLPPADLELTLALHGDGSTRTVQIDARSPGGLALLQALS